MFNTALSLIQYKTISTTNIKKCLLIINEGECVVCEKTKGEKGDGLKMVHYVIIMYFYISIFVGRAKEDVSSYLRCLFISFWSWNVSFLKWISTNRVGAWACSVIRRLYFHYFVMFAINILRFWGEVTVIFFQGEGPK